jgi:hypothetical protein
MTSEKFSRRLRARAERMAMGELRTAVAATARFAVSPFPFTARKQES